MKKLLKNTLLMSMSFAAIGAGLSLIDVPVAQTIKAGLEAISPTIAESLGFTKGFIADLAANNTAWSGAFFGMFGAASVLIPAGLGKITGLGPTPQEKAPKVEIQHGKGVSLKLEQELEPEVDAPFPDLSSDYEPAFSTKITAERADGQENQLG